MSTNALVRGNQFNISGFVDCIAVSDFDNVSIIDNNALNGGSTFVDANDSTGLLIMGNRQTEAHEYGIRCDTIGGLIIKNNIIRRAGQDGAFAGIRINDTQLPTTEDGPIVEGNLIESAGGSGIEINLTDRALVRNNFIRGTGRHGIHLNDANENQVTDNFMSSGSQETDNTFDGIHLEDDCDENRIQQNTIRADGSPSEFRYGVNVASVNGNLNIVELNDLRAGADFGTGAFNDSGTGTVTTLGNYT